MSIKKRLVAKWFDGVYTEPVEVLTILSPSTMFIMSEVEWLRMNSVEGFAQINAD